MKTLLNVSKHADDLDLLLGIFQPLLTDHLRQLEKKNHLLEIVLDLGFPPELRFVDGFQRLTALGEVSANDISKVVAKLSPFNTDNRTGIPRTLHRISAIRNREGGIVGLTCRVGRAVVGTVEIIQDLIEGGRSCLFLGPPGIGKTTLLRETARVLSVDCDRRVIVVDTSNEIAGDGDIPHPGIGYARRMQVSSPDRQHAVMIEAVENHTPEAIIVDEIGTEAEAAAARTIAERGVQLIATAHGCSLDNLIKNPTLTDLLGGIQSVVLGDEEAKFRGSSKTVLERKSKPTFDVLIEIRSRDVFVVYDPLLSYVDAMLLHHDKTPEFRTRGEFVAPNNVSVTSPEKVSRVMDVAKLTPASLYLYGVSSNHVKAALQTLQLPLTISRCLDEVDFVLTLQSKMGSGSKLKGLLKGKDLDIHALREGTLSEILAFLRQYYSLPGELDQLEADVFRETELACEAVKKTMKMVELAAQSEYFRRLQHQVVHQAGLNSMSVGEEPNRRVRVYPVASQ
ncbi:MAG: R3H domain-containing nucleic acid-binding protein [bacterium]